MVRAENNTIFGSVAQAKTAECAVCGNRLKFSEQKDKDSGVESIQAKHCGRIYTIAQSGQASIGMGTDPEYQKKEGEVTKKQAEAKKLRREGKEDEALKKEQEARDDANKLTENQDEANASEEPKAVEGNELKKPAPATKSRF
jgi:hypothetical protein